MISWPYRPLSDFLTEREGRFKPNDPKIATFKRLDKIDFSGQIHISEKPSKTDMIVIEPGDLVISGINVAKGALAVYEGDEPVTATIHYSSYTFDKNRIDIAFLKRFLKSPAFISELQDQVKGGIKTEIKPKHLLPLKARIPELAKQQKINHHFDAVENEISDLSNEIYSQSTYLTKLRQAILQEAIEGKLTADWRKENPVRKGDPDYDAEALLEKIQVEKEKLIKEGKIKKQKSLAPIKADEVPFELPEGWVCTRLGEVCQSITDGDHQPPPKQKEGIPFLVISNVSSGVLDFNNTRFVSEEYFNNLQYDRRPLKGDILYTVTGSYGIPILLKEDHKFCIQRHISIIRPMNQIIKTFLVHLLLSPQCKKQADNTAWGVAVKTVSLNNLRNFILTFPPLAEQQAIVERVEKLLHMVDELEKQVTERKEQSEQLMQAVLREAFEGGK